MTERLGADIERVRIGIGSDPRIGFQFIWPGCGYGGSCFPKDVQALVRTAQQAGYMPELLQAVEAVTQFQKQRLHGLISQHFGGAKGLAGRRFALWGLAFKPNTDDMRDASASLSRGHRRWSADTRHHEGRGHKRGRCPGDLHRMKAVYGPQFRSVGSRPTPQVDL